MLGVVVLTVFMLSVPIKSIVLCVVMLNAVILSNFGLAGGASIIKLYAVIYGFRNKLECLSTNTIRLERLAKDKHSSLIQKP